MITTMICALVVTTTINGMASTVTTTIGRAPLGYMLEQTNCCPSGFALVRGPNFVSDKICDPSNPHGDYTS